MSNENKSGISEFYFDSLHCSQFFDEHNRKEEKNNLQSYVTVKDTLESIFPICLWNFGQAKARKTWKLPRIVLNISNKPCYSKTETDEADEASEILRRKQRLDEHGRDGGMKSSVHIVQENYREKAFFVKSHLNSLINSNVTQ